MPTKFLLHASVVCTSSADVVILQQIFFFGFFFLLREDLLAFNEAEDYVRIDFLPFYSRIGSITFFALVAVGATPNVKEKTENNWQIDSKRMRFLLLLLF